jgi:hypothetical protein
MGNSQSVWPDVSPAAGGAGRHAHWKSLATYRGKVTRGLQMGGGLLLGFGSRAHTFGFRGIAKTSHNA